MSRLSDVNAFIDQSRLCRTANDLRAIMEAITREMGFDAYALFQQVERFSWAEPNQIAISNYSRGWLEYYFAQDFGADDPVQLASRRTGLGFQFAEMPGLVGYGEAQRRIVEAGRRAGIGDGFCVPIHIPGEASGSCTFTVHPGKALPTRNLAAAQLVGSFAYEAGRRLKQAGAVIVEPRPGAPASGAAAPVPTPAVRRLTGRQLDCLILVARGKTDWEIARILGIGQETVKHHLRLVRQHYDVTTRTQAAVRALLAEDVALSDLLF